MLLFLSSSSSSKSSLLLSATTSTSLRPFKMSSYHQFGLLFTFIILFDTLKYGLCELQCEKITIPACQNLGYNMTVVENYAGYTSQKDAEIMVCTFLVTFIKYIIIFLLLNFFCCTFFR